MTRQRKKPPTWRLRWTRLGGARTWMGRADTPGASGNAPRNGIENRDGSPLRTSAASQSLEFFVRIAPASPETCQVIARESVRTVSAKELGADTLGIDGVRVDATRVAKVHAPLLGGGVNTKNISMSTENPACAGLSLFHGREEVQGIFLRHGCTWEPYAVQILGRDFVAVRFAEMHAI